MAKLKASANQSRLEREAEALQPAKAVDPMVIIAAVTEILKLVQSCRKNGTRWTSIRKNGREDRQRNVMRRRIVRRIGADGFADLGGMDFIDRTLERGEGLNAADIDELLDQI